MISNHDTKIGGFILASYNLFVGNQYSKVDTNLSLKTKYPKLIKEWDYERNTLKPENVLPGSNKTVYWLCSINHSWPAKISSRVYLNSGCPFCAGKKPSKENNLKTKFPTIAKDWDYKKNDKNPEDYTFSSNKKVFWNCHICLENYETSINHRTSQKQGCPFCSNQKLSKNSQKSLAYLYPEIAKEWDNEKNKKTPDQVFPNSHSYAFWICTESQHTWKARIDSRLLVGCPYCRLTPRSKEELYLLYELKLFFKISENDHKIKLNKIVDVDIKLKNEKVVIEYDGAYWHQDKLEKDRIKTKLLFDSGWTVIRVREKPLNLIDSKYNVSSIPGDYKNTAGNVLKKLSKLGFKVNNLQNYLDEKKLLNKTEADKYISKLLKENNK